MIEVDRVLRADPDMRSHVLAEQTETNHRPVTAAVSSSGKSELSELERQIAIRESSEHTCFGADVAGETDGGGSYDEALERVLG